MGMPVITPGESTRSQAITDIIESVALQETALSHIINAEGEKMQAIIGMEDISSDELLEPNNSVQTMITAILRLEIIIQSKLELFSDEL